MTAENRARIALLHYLNQDVPVLFPNWKPNIECTNDDGETITATPLDVGQLVARIADAIKTAYEDGATAGSGAKLASTAIRVAPDTAPQLLEVGA